MTSLLIKCAVIRAIYLNVVVCDRKPKIGYTFEFGKQTFGQNFVYFSKLAPMTSVITYQIWANYTFYIHFRLMELDNVIVHPKSCENMHISDNSLHIP